MHLIKYIQSDAKLIIKACTLKVLQSIYAAAAQPVQLCQQLSLQY